MRRTMLIPLKIVLIIGFLFTPYFNSAPLAASAPEKKLVIVIPQEPTTLDPSLIGTGPDFVLVENWGEYLLATTPSGDLKSRLATSWKVSPDGKKVEFTLRKGVKFHSGDLLTAKDVEFSFDRGRTRNPMTKSALVLMERLKLSMIITLGFTSKPRR